MSRNNTKKDSAKPGHDELRPEYDLSRLKGGVRGKYHKQAKAGGSWVLLDPDVARTFPDSVSVNRALRLLRDAATKSPARKARPVQARRKATG